MNCAYCERKMSVGVGIYAGPKVWYFHCWIAIPDGAMFCSMECLDTWLADQYWAWLWADHQYWTWLWTDHEESEKEVAP